MCIRDSSGCVQNPTFHLFSWSVFLIEILPTGLAPSFSVIVKVYPFPASHAFLLFCKGAINSSWVLGASHTIPSLNPLNLVAEKTKEMSDSLGILNRNLGVSIWWDVGIFVFIFSSSNRQHQSSWGVNQVDSVQVQRKRVTTISGASWSPSVITPTFTQTPERSLLPKTAAPCATYCCPYLPNVQSTGERSTRRRSR